MRSGRHRSHLPGFQARAASERGRKHLTRAAPARGSAGRRLAALRSAPAPARHARRGAADRRRVADLSPAQQQMVEIARVLEPRGPDHRHGRALGPLTDRELDNLFSSSAGSVKEVGIIYISHRLQEIDDIGDRVTVLRDGRKVGTFEATRSTGRPWSATWSVGRSRRSLRGAHRGTILRVDTSAGLRPSGRQL